MKTKHLLIVGLLGLLGIAAYKQITITEYKTPSGAVCWGDPKPFDCEFPPQEIVVTIGPGITPTHTPTATASPTRTPIATITRTPLPITSTPTVTAVPPVPANLLFNPDFEQPSNVDWIRFDRWPELPVFNDERGHPESRHNGAQSLRIFNESRCHLSGVYQRVSVTQFQTYLFSAWVRTFGSNSSTFPGQSDLSITDAGEVGIDPNGGIDPGATSVIWAKHEGTEQWRKISVQAVALSSRITVFIQARLGVAGGSACQWPIPFLIGFIDQATLEIAP